MDRFLEFIAEWSVAISFVMVIAAFAISILTVRAVLREVKKRQRDETFGEDVPPEFPGSMRPRSFPKDFGKSPGRK